MKGKHTEIKNIDLLKAEDHYTNSKNGQFLTSGIFSPILAIFLIHMRDKIDNAPNLVHGLSLSTIEIAQATHFDKICLLGTFK